LSIGLKQPLLLYREISGGFTQSVPRLPEKHLQALNIRSFGGAETLKT